MAQERDKELDCLIYVTDMMVSEEMYGHVYSPQITWVKAKDGKRKRKV